MKYDEVGIVLISGIILVACFITIIVLIVLEKINRAILSIGFVNLHSVIFILAMMIIVSVICYKTGQDVKRKAYFLDDPELDAAK